jgi:Putative Ig domain/Secretion system C-terminal sorting domain/WD40-like Beta Propeller Repeat
MKKFLLITAVLFLVQVCIAQILPENTKDLAVDVTGPYFGQTPPGTTPKLFAPEVLAHPGGLAVVTRIAFSPDGRECYFSGPTDFSFANTRMYHTKCIGNVWTPIELVSFFPGSSCRQPYFSADGNTLYFGSNYNSTSANIWMVVRTAEGWGTPQVLPEPINSSSYDGMYTQASDGTIYIESNRPGGLGSIDVYRISPHQPGQPLQIQNLGVPVNTSSDDNDPFVSPDGRYLIFGSNYNDLFVSFNKGNGGWTAPLNLNIFYPGINTGDQEYAPYISSDGRYLFFSRWAAGGIYWVSTSCIDSLRNINFPPYVKNQIPNQTAVKDSLFNYQVPDSAFYDDNLDSLTYSAILPDGNPLPSWLSFDSVTHTFSGFPTASGLNYIKVIATDTAKTSASCIFKLTIANPTGVEENKSQPPKESQLLQNYPNPFNPSTVISYRLSASSNVKLSIYNVLGQKIKTLVDSYQSASEHSLVWDAMDDNNNSVGSGIYFYKLETRDHTLQKKMVLLK